MRENTREKGVTTPPHFFRRRIRRLLGNSTVRKCTNFTDARPYMTSAGVGLSTASSAWVLQDDTTTQAEAAARGRGKEVARRPLLLRL
jgi:hypothetical protein